MEITENVDRLNKRLRDVYGVDTVTGKEMWRVVWSNDQIEKRLDTWQDRTPEGIFIREVYEAREVKKYPYIVDRYILENLQGVPFTNDKEMLGLRMSYEPMWTFEDRNGNYLPPYFEGCQFIIDTIHQALGKKQAPIKHPDAGKDREQILKEKADRLNNITDELFGDQSKLTEVFGDTVIINSSGKLVN